MAKVVITTIPYWGHVNVTLSLGCLLLQDGHEVVWVMAKEMEGLILPRGGRLVLTNRPDDSELNLVLGKLDSACSKSALEGSMYVMEQVLLPLGKLMFRELYNFLHEFQPDLLIHDEQTYIGAICSYILKIPYVTTHAAPSGIFEGSNAENVRNWYFNTIGVYQEYFGLSRKPYIVRSKKLGLAFCPRELSNPGSLMTGQVFVGPCLDVPREYLQSFEYHRIKESKNKNLMVSIGTLLAAEAKSFFQKIIDDFSDSSYNVIVAADPELCDCWPDNFIVQHRVPHLDLLKYLDVVITHGGANTVCDCIGTAIPMVVVPMAYDQYHVGDQIELNQIGKRLRYKRLKPGILRQSCDTLVKPGNIYKQNVEKLSRIYLAAGGATRAAELVKRYLQEGCH